MEKQMIKSKDNAGQNDIGCLEAIERLYAWLDGEVKEATSVTEIERHLSHCRSCFSRAEMERALTAHIRKSARSRAPEALQNRLRTLMKER
jgi:anti-sigma factor (TIGR02949 family)